MKNFRWIISVLLILSLIAFSSNAMAKKYPLDIWAGIPQDVRAEIERLQSKVPEERNDAAEKLGQMGNHAVEARQFLIQLFHDDERYYVEQPLHQFLFPFGCLNLPEPYCPAKTAAVALSKIGGDELVISLQFMAGYGDPKQRFWAAYTLGLIDTKLLTPDLLDSLAVIRDSLSGSLYEQIELIERFSKNRDTTAIDYLIDLATTPRAFYADDAISALGEIGDKRAVEPLLLLLKQEATCVVAADALGKIGDRRAIKPIIKECSYGKNFWYRPIRALGYFDEKEVIEVLLQYMKEEEGLVRTAAVEALGRIGRPEAVSSIISEFEKSSNSRDLRLECLVALHRIGGQEAILAIYRHSKSDIDELVRWRAEDVLKELSGAGY